MAQYSFFKSMTQDENEFDKKVSLPDNHSTKSEEKIIIPVIEEQIKIDKKIVETGKVHISKVVYEDVDQYTIPFVEEHVSVERIAKNEFVNTAPPAIRYEGDVMIISVLKEVAVVEKRIMLVEELRVTKYKTEKSETHEIALRKEEVEINRTQPNSNQSSH